MAVRVKGITVEIGGDTTKLSSALKDTNKEIKSTQDQLKDVERLLKLDPTNTELLRQKQLLLSDAIGETKQKLDTLKAAEDQLTAQGVDKNSQQFMALEREIIATEAQMGELDKSAQEADKAVEGVASTDLSGLGEGVKAGVVAFGEFAAAAGAAAVAVGGALAGMTRDGAAYADTVLTESTITGISTQKLQEYMYASELLDVSVETLTGSMTKNIRSMSSAAEGSGAAAEAYDKLGISVTNSDGTLRDGETVYWEVIEALGGIENETEADALAMDILGKSARDLKPLIQAGGDAVEELGVQAREAGYVLSDEALGEFGAFDDQLQKLSKGADAAKNALGTILLPVLTDVATTGVDLLAQFTTSVQDANLNVDGIGESINGILPQVSTLLASVLPPLIELLGAILPPLESLMASLLPPIIKLVDTLLPPITQIVEMLLPPLISMLTPLLDLLGPIIDLLTPILDLVVSLLQPITDLINQLITPLITIITKLISLALDPLKDRFGEVSSVLSGTFKMAVDNVLNQVKTIKGVFDGLITFISGVFKGDWKKAWEGVKQIFSSVWEGIKEAFKIPINWIIDGINGFIRGINKIQIPDWVPGVGGKGLNIAEIPKLANGGILSAGTALVGEAGPELLTVNNGKAVVQPLTTNNHSFSAPLTVNVYGSAGQDVGQLADAVADRIQLYIDRKEAAFA